MCNICANILDIILSVLIYILLKVKPKIKYGIIYNNSISFVVDKICSRAKLRLDIIKNVFLFFIFFLNYNLNDISSRNGKNIHKISEYIILLLNNSSLLPASLLDIPFGIMM